MSSAAPITGLGVSFKFEDDTYMRPLQIEVGFEVSCKTIGFVKEKDESCRFYVENLDNGRVRLKDHNLLYLRHTDRDGKFPVLARQKTPGETCEFKLFNKNEKVLFQAADTDLWLSRYTKAGVTYLSAIKTVADKQCEFLPELFL